MNRQSINCEYYEIVAVSRSPSVLLNTALTKRKGAAGPLFGKTLKIGAGYCAIAFSQMSWVQAPCGALLITGSEPPASRIFTVRS